MIARLFRVIRDVLDPVDPHAVMQRRPTPVGHYDERKAIAGKRRARERQAKARKLHDVSAQTAKPNVLPMPKARTR